MKKAWALFFVLILLIFIPCVEAAEVYLKNGSVIKGVASYKQVKGKIVLSVYGGIIEIPEEDVLRIEDNEPLKKAVEPERRPTEPAREPEKEPVKERPTYVLPPEPEKPVKDPLKERLAAIEGRLEEIKKEEETIEKLKTEYDEVRLRIEVLFQRGRKGALSAGKGEIQWLNYLNPQERQWIQMNTLRKGELEKEMSELEPGLNKLLKEKDGLLEEKAGVEGKLKKASEQF